MTKKRSDGESSIYQDGAGRWHGFVSMGAKDDGARDRRHVSGKTRPAVVTKVRDLEQKRDAGITPKSGKLTVGQWLDVWVTTVAPRRVRDRTLEGYAHIVRVHLAGVRRHQIGKLQPEHLDAHYLKLAESGLSQSTVLRVHRVLSRALKVAMQRGLVARNVATLVDAPSAATVEIEPLTQDDARAVLAAAALLRNGARWVIALSLGLRQSEALGLQWRYVDLDAGTLAVRWGLHRVKGKGLVLEEPKSARSRRTILLPRPLVTLLRAHRRAQLAERLAAGDVWEEWGNGPGGLVFAQPNGRPIDKRADHRAWQELLKGAAVPPARLHDARHTAATLLLIQGVERRVVADLLGHAQMRTTDIYQHVVPILARDAADQMETALWG